MSTLRMLHYFNYVMATIFVVFYFYQIGYLLLGLIRETSFPFVIYKRNSLTPEYTKDRYGTGDTVSVEIVVASDNYLNSVTIAEEVRKSLENKRGSYDNFDVIDSKLISANEDFIEDTFIQSLVFSFKTE